VAAVAAPDDVLIGATVADTLANLAAAINGGAGAGVAYGTGTVAHSEVSAVAAVSTVALTAKTAGVAGNLIATTSSSAVHMAFSGATFANGSDGGSLASDTAATATLASVNNAIQFVANMRGAIGANINRLQSASNVMNNQVQNLTAAEDGIRAADIPAEVANLTKYSILNQTAISALAQANQMQQSVLALLK
jgi:flagellin